MYVRADDSESMLARVCVCVHVFLSAFLSLIVSLSLFGINRLVFREREITRNKFFQRIQTRMIISKQLCLLSICLSQFWTRHLRLAALGVHGRLQGCGGWSPFARWHDRLTRLRRRLGPGSGTQPDTGTVDRRVSVPLSGLVQLN